MNDSTIDSLRLLFVSSREPSWVGITIQLSHEGVREPHYRWSSTPQEALTILRREIFDAIIITKELADEDTPWDDQLILQLVEAMRTSGHDEPALLVTSYLSDLEWAQLCQHDCDVLISQRSWDAPSLLPAILRAVNRVEVHRSNRKLETTERKRTVRDRTDVDSILKHLHQILEDRQLLSPTSRDRSEQIPEELRKVYSHLLRTFCMMGEGSLTAELTQLSGILTTAHLSTTTALRMHLEETQTLITKLGAKGARHVLVRADLLIIELLTLMGDEWYSHSKV